MSSLPDQNDRLKKLKKIRDKLCKKEKTWSESLLASDWIIDQVKTLRSMSESETHTKDDIKARLEDILCALEQSTGEDDE